MSDLVIISPDERGFYHIDFYEDGENYDYWHWQDGISPDGFATTAKGASEDDAKLLAEKHWPNAKIEFAALDDDEDDEE